VVCCAGMKLAVNNRYYHGMVSRQLWGGVLMFATGTGVSAGSYQDVGLGNAVVLLCACVWDPAPGHVDFALHGLKPELHGMHVFLQCRAAQGELVCTHLQLHSTIFLDMLLLLVKDFELVL